jgi:hypothetical protein
MLSLHVSFAAKLQLRYASIGAPWSSHQLSPSHHAAARDFTSPRLEAWWVKRMLDGQGAIRVTKSSARLCQRAHASAALPAERDEAMPVANGGRRSGVEHPASESHFPHGAVTATREPEKSAR